MEKKTFELEIKELNDEGKFSGHLSTFGNVDSGGDVVDPGAFKKTLRENKAFAFLWSHQGMPDTVAGSFEGQEDDKGLAVKGGFYLDLDGGLKAYKTAKRLKADGVKIGLSMGYRAVKFVYETIEGITVRRLKEVKLKEGSITLWPMNEQAQLEAIKEEPEEFTYEQKPYPNEHACRLNDPGKYERFARMTRSHEGKKYSVIIGFKKGGGSEDQAYRYPKDTWSADEARKHCKDHKGSFEAATGKTINFICKSCGETLTLTEPAGATLPGTEPSKSEPSELHSVLQKIADKIKSQ